MPLFRWIKGLQRRLNLLPQISARTDELMCRQQQQFDHLLALNSRMRDRLDSMQQALARVESRQLSQHPVPGLIANEFRVYSQFGEDGIIQFLFRHIPVEQKKFVEFGVEDYQECNTRFLLLNDRWSGLVLDGSAENVARIKCDYAYMFRDLTAVHAFITVDNINHLLRENGSTGEIGLLSIDIDGNDYWVWQAIDVVNPAVVVIEYNYRFGTDVSVVVPYKEDFYKNTAHPSAVYYGASLRAICHLANRKGYVFVGCSRGGVNAFFVRKDKKPDTIQEVTVEEGYVAGQHAEVRDSQGNVIKMSLEEQQRMLMSLPLVKIGDCLP